MGQSPKRKLDSLNDGQLINNGIPWGKSWKVPPDINGVRTLVDNEKNKKKHESIRGGISSQLSEPAHSHAFNSASSDETHTPLSLVAYMCNDNACAVKSAIPLRNRA